MRWTRRLDTYDKRKQAEFSRLAHDRHRTSSPVPIDSYGVVERLGLILHGPNLQRMPSFRLMDQFLMYALRAFFCFGNWSLA